MINKLKAMGLNLIEDADMSRYTSFRAGGHAAALVEVETKDELKAVLQFVNKENIPHIMLGNGSNMLFRDSGYEGLVIRLSQTGFDYIEYSDEEACTVHVGTAMKNGVLAKILQQDGLAGFEFASGIPGSIGGAVFMNAGAYGGEMKDIVKSVKAISPDGLEERIFTAEEMDFSYRHSILEENGYIAVEVTMELKKGDKEEIAACMKELLEKRNSKQPVNYPSAGSTFKRPEGYFAGKLIEDAGLKGLTVGGAQVSTLHSGFVINTGGATATDILQLMALVQNTVYDKFGVMLEPEVRIIG
ncbi:MAG: UDP-N-acetylmuramate dehydrogenase [Firmicutes bacterium]|nr:UDP-N-acetylmuramate dehydrogenase [Bacillota bacterium]